MTIEAETKEKRKRKYKKVEKLKTVKYCKCGCGLLCDNKYNYIKGHYIKMFKGKSYVERFGIEKKEEILEKRWQTKLKNDDYEKNRVEKMLLTRELNKEKNKENKINRISKRKQTCLQQYLQLPPISKHELYKYAIKKQIMYPVTIKKLFGTIENLALESGKPFLENKNATK